MNVRLMCALVACWLSPAIALAADVSGTALLPGNAAPPEDAVFTATLADTSLADAPATVLSKDTRSPAGAPPYDFTLPFTPEDIVDRHRYSVRATLHSPEGALLFTTDTNHPVITNGVATLQVSMRAVTPSPPTATLTATGLRLPATFVGSLPCADCEGIDHALTLWPEGGFHMSRTWRGRNGDLSVYDLGYWQADPARNAVVLDAGEDQAIRFEVKDDARLRLLARDGTPIGSDLNYDVVAGGPVRDLDMVDIFTAGRFEQREGVLFFAECTSGRAYPVTGASNDEIPDEPMFALIEGDIGMHPEFADRFGRSITIRTVVTSDPAGSYDQHAPRAPLLNTYWSIETLRGTPLADSADRPEAHIVLLPGDTPRYSATVGCNRVNGAFALGLETLTFQGGAMTRMACPPPVDAMERELVAVLSETTQYRAFGKTLVLKNESDDILAVLNAVYAR